MGTSRSNTTGGGRGALNRLVRSPGVDVRLVDPTAVLDRMVGTGISVPGGLSTVDFPSAGWGQVHVPDAPLDPEWLPLAAVSTAS